MVQYRTPENAAAKRGVPTKQRREEFVSGMVQHHTPRNFAARRNVPIKPRKKEFVLDMVHQRQKSFAAKWDVPI